VHPNLTIQSIIKRFESFKREIEKGKNDKNKKQIFFFKNTKMYFKSINCKRDFSGG
jgi:hypothetical protein